MSHHEYLLRVRPAREGGYYASVRQLQGAAHPEVRAVVGHVGFGRGETEMAAALAALAQHRLGPSIPEVRRGC